MHALDVLGDPVRRRLVELLARGDRASGDLTEVIRAEFGISQPAVSNHLRVLREAGFAHSSAEGSRRIYSLDGERMTEVQDWVAEHLGFWTNRLDALGTELRRNRTEER
ncbi:transcriptional regulator [Microbacterium sp. B35-04]|uniref:ArsR/SmtB family transcription factor n=1 Tax=unclassified Microbacterium TaxID=2609290 RepID=UPI0013D27633|nr:MULTISPECIES: metalloregulator ArsR/SmtB family transcription factor [unclassified Microbacterium]KAF2415313.1 transcriptional regulator [Microbacterium sp. B35-04]KAF2420259.1 transcriptional regulator [Microbacterium sp. B35-30]